MVLQVPVDCVDWRRSSMQVKNLVLFFSGGHAPRYEGGRLYARPSSVAEGGNYSRHDPSDYYHHHPLHTQNYGRPGTTSVSSERPGSRSRQHIENYTAL